MRSRAAQPSAFRSPRTPAAGGRACPVPARARAASRERAGLRRGPPRGQVDFERAQGSGDPLSAKGLISPPLPRK
eukprot:1795549-Alexandrium_andersonii.AAC.1